MWELTFSIQNRYPGAYPGVGAWPGTMVCENFYTMPALMVHRTISDAYTCKSSPALHKVCVCVCMCALLNLPLHCMPDIEIIWYITSKEASQKNVHVE